MFCKIDENQLRVPKQEKVGLFVVSFACVYVCLTVVTVRRYPAYIKGLRTRRTSFIRVAADRSQYRRGTEGLYS